MNKWPYPSGNATFPAPYGLVSWHLTHVETNSREKYALTFVLPGKQQKRYLTSSITPKFLEMCEQQEFAQERLGSLIEQFVAEYTALNAWPQQLTHTTEAGGILIFEAEK